MIVEELHQVNNKAFDYIICGGGTAGVSLAVKLSEKLPEASILLLEAGGDNLQHKDVVNPKYGKAFTNSDLCWQHPTDEPKGVGNLGGIRGKGLGGSSTVNFMMWSIPPKQDLDDFERLGNVGWNWNRFRPHFRDLEGYSNANEQDAPLGLTVDSAVGTEGPLKLSCLSSPSKDYKMVQENFIHTLNKLHIPEATHPYDGMPHGSFLPDHTIDAERKIRSNAGRVFADSIRGGHRLHVLLHA
jgi:choline dehydrogenase-like flavoprotein